MLWLGRHGSPTSGDSLPSPSSPKQVELVFSDLCPSQNIVKKIRSVRMEWYFIAVRDLRNKLRNIQARSHLCVSIFQRCLGKFVHDRLILSLILPLLLSTHWVYSSRMFLRRIMFGDSISLSFSSELVSSLSAGSSIPVSGSAQGLSVRAWFRCVLQQHLHKNSDGTDSRTGNNTHNTTNQCTKW